MKHENQPPTSDQKHQPKQSPYKDYVKYSGLGFQMAALLLLAYWGGSKLDAWFGFRGVWIIVLMLLALGMSFYSLFKNLPKG